MNPSAPFAARPVAPTLLMIAITLAGLSAFLRLRSPPCRRSITRPFALMPGANPETMAATIAASLERQLGMIADASEMTSERAVGRTTVILHICQLSVEFHFFATPVPNGHLPGWGWCHG